MYGKSSRGALFADSHAYVVIWEKLRKKSALLLEDEGMTEKEKAQKITRMINRASKKKPKQQLIK